MFGPRGFGVAVEGVQDLVGAQVLLLALGVEDPAEVGEDAGVARVVLLGLGLGCDHARAGVAGAVGPGIAGEVGDDHQGFPGVGGAVLHRHGRFQGQGLLGSGCRPLREMGAQFV